MCDHDCGCTACSWDRCGELQARISHLDGLIEMAKGVVDVTRSHRTFASQLGAKSMPPVDDDLHRNIEALEGERIRLAHECETRGCELLRRS